MTIRNRLALRFTGLVSAILLLTFVSIYAFCSYNIALDFYRRLDLKAQTTGDRLTRSPIDSVLISQLGRIRKDQLPNQHILVYDSRDSLIFSSPPASPIRPSASLLAKTRQSHYTEARLGKGFLTGRLFETPAGPYRVLAYAENLYGDRFLRQLLLALGGLFVVIVGIIMFSGWVYAGDALRPMKRLDQRLNAIFPQNRDERLPVGPEVDEISRLSATINRLLDRVAESFRVQRLFVANVSHELKNPLTQISSQLEVSLLNERDPAAYRQTIRSVLEDVTDLTALTQELLQLSRVSQHDAADLLTETLRLDELMWDVRDEVNDINPRYAVTLQLSELPEDPDSLLLRGNRTLLRSAFRNLIENACKFSETGDALVQVRFTTVAVQVLVRNDGQPILADDLPYLFEPFFRSRLVVGQVKGYGVGLSLVDRIIRLHGGQVSVSSGQGEPTEFRVTLPRREL